MNFQNKSVFFVPMLVKSYKTFADLLVRDKRFLEIKPEDRKISYLLKYAKEISCRSDCYREFKYTDHKTVSEKLFDSSNESDFSPEICDIRVSLFSTEIAFAEFHISYGNMTVDEIVNFAYKFKKADKKNSHGFSLAGITKEMFPSAEIFFTASADFKQECDCFHMIKTDKAIDSDKLDSLLYLLSWSYNHNFEKANRSEETGFDMTYFPYQYDAWGGSQNGLVNIFRNTDDESTNFFLETYKPNHLIMDYRFMYLMLLNQRYSAIEYISQIANWEHRDSSELKKLNQKITTLKTTFSFRIISDDKIFQNVYLKMYNVLEIDSLLSDIRDNEEMMDILRSEDSVRADRFTSGVLFCLSLLSLFSALIDAAGYFDRFDSLKDISTPLSLLCISLFSIICIFLLFRSKYK